LVDIHSHVLYGLDDGPATLEDSVAMVRMAVQYGTTDLVVTPHANHEFCFDPDRIAQRIAEVTDACDQALRIYAGCDFHLSYGNIEGAIANPSKYSINRKQYLLVEFSDLLIFHNTQDIFVRLGEAGLIPVITHPERNALLRKRIDDIAGWVYGGACVQVTAQSLIGKFGKKASDFCRELLDRGLVHFVASDAHDCEYRPPRMDQARDWLVKNYGEKTAEVLCLTNPRAAVQGEALEPLEPIASSRTGKWLHFWR
jgi:protein-tyrosine phosphatase